ncbi:MAG TPA: hypothetical protein VHB77_15680 [Planctomycetaceae bacterium]|nr:hypothetical protein [Planctomycetaceae bacterium]
MIKKLVKTDDGYALVIDDALLNSLGATGDSAFEVSAEGQQLIVKPVRTSDEEARFEAALDMVHDRFGRAMKRLAE